VTQSRISDVTGIVYSALNAFMDTVKADWLRQADAKLTRKYIQTMRWLDR